jgi:hypothetical protein
MPLQAASEGQAYFHRCVRFYSILSDINLFRCLLGEPSSVAFVNERFAANGTVNNATYPEADGGQYAS